MVVDFDVVVEVTRDFFCWSVFGVDFYATDLRDAFWHEGDLYLFSELKFLADAELFALGVVGFDHVFGEGGVAGE